MVIPVRVGSFVVTLSMVVPALAGGDNDAELIARFREEVPREWPVVQKWGVSLECSGVLTRTLTPQGKPPKTTTKKVTCRRKDDNMLIEVRRRDEVSVGGSNPKYSFHVTREGKEDGPWVISNVFASGDAKESIKKSFQWYSYYCVNPCVSLPGIPRADVFREQGFHITGMEQFRSDGREAVRIRFSYTPQAHSAEPESGWMVLLPEEHWTIMEFEVLYPNIPRTLHGNITYGDRLGACRAIRRFNLTIQNPKSRDEYLFETTQVSTCSLSDQDFTLPAFGLPEVTSASVARSRLWFWFIAISGLFLLLGVFLRRWSRRKQIPSAP
jgi:hypothetical protein